MNPGFIVFSGQTLKELRSLVLGKIAARLHNECVLAGRFIAKDVP